MASAGKATIEKNLTGRVKWFDIDKGYGFIKRDNNGGDLFVHSSECEVGFFGAEEEVRFDVGMGRKGPEAINVKSATDSTRSARGLRSVFRQLARLETLFGRGGDDDDDDEYYDEDGNPFDYYSADSDLEEYLRNYEDDSYMLDDDDDDDDDDDYDESYEDMDDDDDEEEKDRPDKFLGLEQLFREPKALPSIPKVKTPPADFANITCSLCDEEAAPIVFRPCQHKVCCLDCSIRLRKCPSCKQTIAKKETWDGREVEVKGAAKYTDLLEIVQAQEETKMCQICMEKKKNTVFGCGHLACHTCAGILTSCHICRKRISIRTKVFED